MPTSKNRSRLWTYGSNTVVSTVFFIGVITLVVLIAERHPWRWDLTEAGTYTLSEQTRNVLESIKEPVEVTAFFATAAPEWAETEDRLRMYRDCNKNIRYEFVDPDRQPEKARQYEVRSYGTVVLEGYGKKQTVLNATEEALTNAVLKLSRTQQKKIYFLVGHGEHSLEELDKNGYSTVRSALQKENYEVAELNLLQQEKLPEDAAALIIAGPQKPLFSQELATLQSYLDGGGKLAVLLDPDLDGGMQEFLKQYGLVLSNDIVIDKLSRVFGGSYLLPVVAEYGPHKITEDFNIATFYPEARSVRAMGELPKGVKVDVLAATSANAWAETDLNLLQQGQASFDEKSDQAGPVPLMVLAEIDIKEKGGGTPPAQAAKDAKGSTEGEEQSRPEQKAYLLVAGDSDWINNTHFGLSGNGDFWLNIVNFLAEEENLITIEPRKGEGQPVILTRQQAQILLWAVLVLVPLIVLTIAFGVYRVRRSQR